MKLSRDVYVANTCELQCLGCELAPYVVYPKANTHTRVYDIYGGNPLGSEAALQYIQTLVKQDKQIRLWTHGHITYETFVTLKPYIHTWCFYAPSCDEHEYRTHVGNQEFNDCVAFLDQVKADKVRYAVHIAVTKENIIRLPDDMRFIRQKKYPCWIHYDKTQFTIDEQNSIHYFERYGDILVLPLRKGYPEGSCRVPLGQGFSLQWRLLVARYRSWKAKLKTRWEV